MLACGLASPSAADDEPASQPASQPAKDGAREYDFDRCLGLVAEYVERENYPMARQWVARALAATKDDATRERVEAMRKRLRLLGRPAPALATETWLAGSAEDLAPMRGYPVLVFFFQVIDQDALHALNHVISMVERYGERGLRAVTIICVLEKPELQPADGIQRFVDANPFNHPVALDAAGRNTFDAYRGTGLPMFALIDRAGRLRCTGPYDQAAVERWSLKLCAESADRVLPGRPIAMPPSPGAVDLLEKRLPGIKTDWWINTPNGRAPAMTGRPRLVRFLHADCEACRRTAKGMQSLHATYAEKGLVVVGLIVPDEKGAPADYRAFSAAARGLEVDFPVTLDRGKATLSRWWADTDPSRAGETDATFVLDRRGRARFVRSGMHFFPPDAGADDAAQEAFDEVDQAIRKVIKERH